MCLSNRSRLVTVLLLFILVLLSHTATAKRVYHPQSLNSPLETPTIRPNGLFKHAIGSVKARELRKRDMECRRVHEFEDKCKFVRENCADEEVGFFDYLELYYCKMGKVPAVPFAIMTTWMVMLFTTIGIAASDFFCINLSTIANILGMSESMAGVTFLAFGNGSPDVFSTFAAMKINSGSLAVGELIGAASFIVAVVAGSMAIVHPFKVGRKSFVRDVSFFIVAVLFGIGFLADGKIEMWECLVMVIFYIFYVCFVVVWHWMSQAKKRRKRKERSAREHYAAPEEEENLLVNEDDEDGGVGLESDALLGGASHDFDALERGAQEDDEEDEEEEEQAAYAELSNNMRISRPRMERSLTPATPHNIRPSLVGALEFRAVLHHLEKTKNLQGRPIHLRRYSDDPFLSVSTTTYSAPGSLINSPLDSLPQHHNNSDHPGRLRAVSVNDATQTTVDWTQTHENPPDINIISPISPKYTRLLVDTSPSSSSRAPSPDLLALPTPHGHPNISRPSPTASEPTTPLLNALPRLLVPESSYSLGGTNSETSSLRVFESPRPSSSRSASPPASIRLPPPSIDSMSLATMSGGGTPQWRQIPYWPYKYLPPPQLLIATLFPTLRGFREKSWVERVLALIAMLPVLLLTITLPVVEAEGGAANEKATHAETPIVVVESDSPMSTATSAAVGHNSNSVGGIGPKEWNRWLVAVQCITAPVFLVVMFAWDDDDSTSIVKPILYALIVGLVCLAGLLVLTRPEKAPRARYLLCFAGFAVSIGWISAIANEVVGVLKAFGVILGISDAILGLTIFAVGNSLGDLVADITVARLGFPVMALSACFGGPMLNILLGIGLSGLYITLSRADHAAYHIEVSSTLVISAATLLVTLVLLLVAVPLNKWTMSRRIGWTLIVLWCVSTVVNVIVEISGIGRRWGGGIAGGT